MRLFLKTFLFSLVITGAMLAGCGSSPYYQKTVALPGHVWTYNYRPSFRFEVKDTTALYHLYFLIRHTEAYPFSNIWIYIYTKKPGAKTFEQSRIEIPLAQDDGKWLGRGMGEIYEQRMPITRDDNPMKFEKTGTYEIRFEQNMRTNPLPEILDIGLRVENRGHKKMH